VGTPKRERQKANRQQRLEELAYNLKWSWDYRARLLFKRLDPDVWKNTQHNPVKLLHTIDTSRLTAAARDPDFLREYDLTMKGLDRAMRRSEKWFPREFPDMAKQSSWDPYLFVGECEQHRFGGDSDVTELVRLQRAEFDVVFDYCWRVRRGN